MRTQIIDKSVVVSAIEGNVEIVLADGSSRPLQKGEILQPGAKLAIADDAKLALSPYDDTPASDVPAGSESAELAQPQVAASQEGAPSDIAALQESILQGVDPTQNFEASAAGGAPAAGGGGGIGGVAGASGNGGFVTIDRTGDATIAAAGFDTTYDTAAVINENQAEDLILENQLDDLGETAVILEDTQVSGNLLDNSTNPDGPVDASIVSYDWGINIGVPAGVAATITGVGTLIINPDGSYTFTPAPNYDGAVPPVNYQVTDGQDTVTSTLVISITPGDEEVELAGFDLVGGEVQVSDANLADGSAPNAAALTQSGVFTFDAPDGVQSLTLGGVILITDGQLGASFPLSIISPLGNVLTISAVIYNPVTGEGQVSYSYILGDNGDHTKPVNDISLSESFSVELIDSDGDTASNTLDVTILDDIPTLADGEELSVRSLVQEDALSSGNSEGTGQSVSASGAPGTLNSLVNFGADGAGSFGLGSDVSSLVGLGLTSGGVALSYSVAGNVLTASAGSVPVFTLTIGVDGSYNFTLSGPLDHPTADGDDGEQLTGVGIDFSGVLTATDGDGDPLTGSFPAGRFVIRGEDDVSVALIETVDISELSLVTQDAQTIGELFDTDSADFSAAFAAAVTANYGADGPGDTKVTGYNLTVSNAVSVLSSNGKPITLVLVEGDIVGRADGVDIFKISVSAGGTVSVTQYAEIDHLPEDADGVDENSNQSLGAGKGQLTATVTVTDGDNDVVSKLVSVDLGSSVSFDDDLPSVDANMAVQLDDDALASGIAGGTGDDPNAVNVSGTLGHSFGADGAGSIQWLTTGAPAGFTYETNPAGALLVIQGATTVLTVTLNSATGAYSVTQNSPIQHANADQENNQAFTLNYQVNDGDTATGTLAINVDDDTPVAKNDTAIVAESSGKDFNVAFVLDSSGSINGTEFATMMAAVRAAGQALFNGTDGTVQITIVAFSIGATYYTAISSLAAFESLVDRILANRPFNDNTNFTAAVEQTMDVYNSILGWSNQVFFISDGNPNVDTGVNNSLQSSTATDWNNFIDSNGINVTTIGVGNGINSTRLQDVDLDGSGSPILVADFDDLIDTLLGQISGNVVGGNVLLGNDNVVGGGDDDVFGADGAGRVLSIEIDGVTTHTWDGADTIRISTGGSILGNQLSNIVTDLGGKLSFNFADGTWSYTAPQSVSADTSESFDYVIIDKDGDPSQATLTVNIEDAAPVIGRVDEGRAAWRYYRQRYADDSCDWQPDRTADRQRSRYLQPAEFASVPADPDFRRGRRYLRHCGQYPHSDGWRSHHIHLGGAGQRRLHLYTQRPAGSPACQRQRQRDPHAESHRGHQG